jgi:hypothetical protein
LSTSCTLPLEASIVMEAEEGEWPPGVSTGN